MLRTSAYSLLLFLLFATHAEAKSWHGITPLKSTREDVAQRLDVSIDPNTRSFKSESPTEDVEFVFSANADYPDCVKRLRPGMVLIIEITPKGQLKLSDLALDKKQLKELQPTGEFIINGQAYADEKEGLVVTFFEGAVRKVVYIASREDQHLCPAYYQETRLFTDRIICMLCPTIAVASPEEIRVGDKATFTATVTSGPRLTFNWTVDAGTIVYGQGTASIMVDTSTAKGETITATVEVGGIDPACNRIASASAAVTKRPAEPR